MKEEPKEAKPIILFVNNFYAKSSMWNFFETNINNDSDLKDAFHIKKFSFLSTSSLNDISTNLFEMINQECKGHELILVSHGLGSIIIFKYLALLTRFENVRSSILIQQIIFLAPIIPNAYKSKIGIRIYNNLKNILLFPFNPIQRLLHLFKMRNLLPEITQLSRLNLNTDLGIPMGAIYGTNDDLIDLRAIPIFFGGNNIIRIDGNHFSILEQNKGSEKNWNEFKKLLIEPFGHRNTILIKKLEVDVVIKKGSGLEKVVYKERTEKSIIEDHIGEIRYSIEISRRNVCLNRVSITSFVQEKGYINELNKNYERFERAAAYSRGTFYRLHTTYRSEFDPDHNRNPYILNLELINGFNDAQFSDENYKNSDDKDKGSFYLPIFLGVGDKYFKKMIVNINLCSFTEYLNVKELELHWTPDEMAYNLNSKQLLKKIHRNDTKIWYEKKEIDHGLWQFCLSNVRRGTIIFTWSLSNK